MTNITAKAVLDAFEAARRDGRPSVDATAPVSPRGGALIRTNPPNTEQSGRLP